jgi:Na+/H+-dicarboxylate symporter
MTNKTGNYILIGMVLGAVLGALGGYFIGGFFIELKFIGTIFLNALKMIVVPLIVASMIVGVASLGDVSRLGRTSGKTLLYYLATTGFSVLIGIILVNIIQPGSGIGSVGSEIPEIVADAKPAGFSDFIVRLIPDNLIAAAAEGSVLPLIIFSLVFGGVLTAIGPKGRPVINFFAGLNTAIMKIVVLIIYFAPIGILAIIGSIVAEKRESLAQIASGLGLYSLTVIIGLIIHAVVILPLILKFMGKKNPLRYFMNMGQALATAFTTASSSTSLPVTMECVTVKNKVNNKAGSFVLPLGATINMDGTALYEAVAAIFIAQAINFPLSIDAQVVIFLTATLASIGAAAIPHAGLVTMVIVLSAVGLPLEGIGFIFAVDWFLDRCRTAVNVWGDSVGAAVIGETVEISGFEIGSGKTKPAPKRKKYDRPKQTYDRRTTAPYGGKKRKPDQRRDQKNGRRKDTRKSHRHETDSTRYQRSPHKKNNVTNGYAKKERRGSSKGKVDKELDKVRRQLTTLEKRNGAIEKSERSKLPKESKPSSDDFFDTKLPNFEDLLNSDDKTEDVEKPIIEDKEREPEKSIPADIESPGSDNEPDDDSGTEDEKDSDSKNAESEDKNDDNSGWGRDRRNRQSR